MVKGALQSVLNTKITYSTYVKENHGRITVILERKPTDQEMDNVFREANRIVNEGLPILREVVPRGEAERIYGNDIYDYFPVPPEVRELVIVKIPGWNINACAKDHTPTTREIGTIRQDYWRFRQSKRLLEVAFDVT
ncbi:Alanyl-tRNA editing protein AlaX-S [Metallosphaera sp. J1]|nr:Alanyl-tRNA editing protein AlaX-S [Metallosphaera javensis (ex Hofmann et al. 2022)]